MLTNPRDAFRDQLRSPNIPFHMLGIVSSCTIVTLSLRRAVFPIFYFKKCRDLEIRVRGHSRSLKLVPFDRLRILTWLYFVNAFVATSSSHSTALSSASWRSINPWSANSVRGYDSTMDHLLLLTTLALVWRGQEPLLQIGCTQPCVRTEAVQQWPCAAG